jgi:hypothetical protein
MVRRVGLTIGYLVAVVYILSIAWPTLYCFKDGCRGPELDAFMPAFALTPIGAIATAFALRNAIQNIRKQDSSWWIFWPLATVFSIVLLGVIVLIALVVYYTAFHRFHR